MVYTTTKISLLSVISLSRAATDPTNGDRKHGPISAVQSSIRSILDDIKKELEGKEKLGKEQHTKPEGEDKHNIKSETAKEGKSGKSNKVDWEEEVNIDKLVDRIELYAPIDLVVPNSPLSTTPRKRPPTQFELRLQQFIHARGPLTVAQYMREVLVSPKGYYMQRDVFGKTGDFVTAPEISQMFGEMIGVWCAHMWEQLGKPPRLKLVEFGPGRGSLMAHFLQATLPFKQFQAALEIHFIEVSPKLREIQQQQLEKFSKIPMEWNSNIAEVPDDAPILAVAQEFFDALPEDYKGVEAWREVLVDWDTEGPHYLRFVSAKGKTGASEAVIRWLPQLASHGDRVQICLEGMEILQNIVSRVAKHGGGALLIDYGNYGTQGETLVAIRNHQPEHIFQSPGEADVSAWVDFKSLRRSLYDSDTYKHITTYGPVSQGEFLRAMGIDFRLVELLKKLDESDPRAEQLIAGYERLVGTEEGQMGASYKAWAFTSKGASPAGFDTAKTPYDDDL